ncbi:hypothetical protein PLESTB_001586100 [Pleodorina starrii]|uniref:Uncharacterized protein n=1 Tax=Pleodorina starrii TaxID=330485 RepID=A0A9W6BY36_9CHLO|nr:hypothetical protein PLESTB_001586100 [Pleodorina starrii]GLC65973.1 hypothetical protein PLESTF_000368100 [Pleodorina starrii]
MPYTVQQRAAVQPAGCDLVPGCMPPCRRNRPHSSTSAPDLLQHETESPQAPGPPYRRKPIRSGSTRHHGTYRGACMQTQPPTGNRPLYARSDGHQPARGASLHDARTIAIPHQHM